MFLACAGTKDAEHDGMILSKEERRSMRRAIVNAVIVTGDGHTILENHSLVMEDGMITDLVPQPYLPYDPAGDIVDASGALVIPGLINHHSHGGVHGPFNVFGERPLPLPRVIYDLNRHVTCGTTTLVNACGWPTMSEVESTAKMHPIHLRATTIHLPIHLKHAKYVDGRGLRTWHERISVEEMLALGAVAIGEIGAPCVAHGTPHISEELGLALSVTQVQQLKESVLGPGIDPDYYQPERLRAVLANIGLAERLTAEQARDLVQRHVVAPYEMTRDCVAEFGELSLKHNVPLLFHNTMDTRDLCLELASRLGPRLIALHSNYTFSASEAVRTAQKLKHYGALIDVFTADAYGARMFHPTPDVTLALFSENLVDLISTDFIAGYWDSIPLILEKAIEAGAISLPAAVHMASRKVVQAIPRIGSDRGLIAPGFVADLVITDRQHLSQIKQVIIGGQTVVRAGRVCPHPMVLDD